MTYALTYKELAERLGSSPETLKKVWRSYPHYFVGSGRNLKSARFDLQDVLDYLKGRDYANLRLPDQTGPQVQGGVQAPGQASHNGRIQKKGRGKGMDHGRKAKAQGSTGDKWGLFRFSN